MCIEKPREFKEVGFKRRCGVSSTKGFRGCRCDLMCAAAKAVKKQSMKIFQVLGLALILVGAVSWPARAQFGELAEGEAGRAIPAGARLSLEVPRTKWFLGENIVVHFRVENAGTEPFKISMGGDYRGAARSTRFKVSVRDAKGVLLEDPYPGEGNFGGMMGTPEVKPGESWFQTLSLLPYRRFETAGEHLVRVGHDLGWRTGKPLPGAEIRLQLEMPTLEQAREIVASMETPTPREDVMMGQKSTGVWRSFSSLRHEVYLPILIERVDAGKLDFLASIGGIDTPDATRALVKFLESDAPTARQSAQILVRRMPRKFRAREWTSFHTRTVERVWRPEFEAPTRLYARREIQVDERERLRLASSMLESVGAPDDLPLVMEALEKRIALTVQTPRWQNVSDHETPDGWQLQDDCLALMRCARSLLERGATLPISSTATPNASVVAVQIEPFRERTPGSPAPAESRVGQWLQHPIPFIRQLALESLTLNGVETPRVPLSPRVRALLPALLTDSDVSVRAAACRVAAQSGDSTLLPLVLQTLRGARNKWLIGDVNRAATALGGRFEMWQIWAARLDEPGMTFPALEALSTVVKGAGGYSSDQSKFEAKETPQLKAQWQNLLRVHRVRLQNGELFAPTDPALDGLFPASFSLSVIETARRNATPK